MSVTFTSPSGPLWPKETTNKIGQPADSVLPMFGNMATNLISTSASHLVALRILFDEPLACRVLKKELVI